MNPNRVKEIMEYVKGSPETMDYGRWGALNPEQRKIIKELCNSWLILDEATNMQTKEIERLQKQKEELQINGLRQETLFKLEIERLNNKIQDLQADYGNKAQVERDLLKEENKKYNKWIESLNKDNHRLNNIIKEVREYITKQVHRNQQFYEMDIENILEILDKGE